MCATFDSHWSDSLKEFMAAALKYFIHIRFKWRQINAYLKLPDDSSCEHNTSGSPDNRLTTVLMLPAAAMLCSALCCSAQLGSAQLTDIDRRRGSANVAVEFLYTW